MLVVRVKRNRSDVAAESICVVEDTNPSKKRSIIGNLADRLSHINTGDNDCLNKLPSHRVLVSRVETLDFIETENNKQNKFENECIYVDMIQSQLNDQTISLTLDNDTHRSVSIIESRTYSDSASEQLDSAIITAMQTGDFNGVSLALQQNGDPNRQTNMENGGHTSLMAAVTHCNLRMVKRLLLSRHVDVTLKDRAGLTVSDMANKLSHNTNSVKIKLLLQTAVNKMNDAKQRVDSTTSSATSNYNSNDDSNCVVDIYTIQTQFTTQPHPSSTTPTIQVKGINISTTGVVTVRRADYDSDWSDLGDDEGVDSDDNDERGENEQYLREKEGELNAETTERKVRFETLSSSSSDDATRRSVPPSEQQSHNPQEHIPQHNDSNIKEVKSATTTAPFDPKLPGRAVCSNTRTRFTAVAGCANNGAEEDNNNIDNNNNHNSDDENDSDFTCNITNNADSDLPLFSGDVSDHDSDGEDDERLPRFDVSTGVGKVIRPYVLPDSKDTQTGALHTVHDSESLRELWDEDSGPINADETGGSVDDHKDKNSRLKEMRARTGMLFGSNPREFLENGLPKYGAELSDDDCDVMTQFVEDGGEYLTECARKEGYVSSSSRVEELDSEESEEVKMDTSSSGEHGSYNVMGSALNGGDKNNQQQHWRGFAGVTSRMPDKSTVAYDSELDNSDSD